MPHFLYRQYRKPMAILAYVILAFIAISCASQQSLTGGPKDETAPTLIESAPINKQTNFSGNELIMVFSEAVKLEQVNTQLVTIPTIDLSQLDFRYRKNIVTIEAEPGTFEPNTTYVFNFREAVKDITEGNPAENLTLAFSTGPYIDSLSISGKVVDLITQKPVEKVTIGLYPTAIIDTTSISAIKPKYFTTTNSEGLFTLETLKNDEYKLYIFKDGNKNLKAEIGREYTGFHPDIITLTTQDTLPTIPLITVDNKPLKLNSARPSGKNFEMKFNKTLSQYSIQYPETLYHHLLENKNTIRIYAPDGLGWDTTSIAVTVYDSINSRLDSTLSMYFTKSGRKQQALKIKEDPKAQSWVPQRFTTTLTFNAPIKVFDSTLIQIAYDSTTLEYLDSSTTYLWNENRTEVAINLAIDTVMLVVPMPDTTGTVTGPDGADGTGEGSTGSNTEVPTGGEEAGGEESASPGQQPLLQQQPRRNPVNAKLTFSLMLPENTFTAASGVNGPKYAIMYEYKKAQAASGGVLKGSLAMESNNYFELHLLSSNGEVVATHTGAKEFTFRDLKAGDYSMRILYDNNGDGKFNYGDLETLSPPEEIIYHPEKLTVRDGWEVSDIIFETGR